MKIQRVLLLGAGAVGILPAAQLYCLPGVDFRILADGERLERYRRDGLLLNGEKLPFRYMAPGEEVFSADLVLIATKDWALRDALPLLRDHVGPHTILVPLLNGISAGDTVEEFYPGSVTLRGFFLGHASVRIGNEVTQDGVGMFYFGERSDERHSQALTATAEFLRSAGVPVDVPEDFRAALWKKYILNVGINQTQAYFKADYGMVQRSPEMLAFARELMQEAAAVARAEGIANTDGMIEAAMETICTMPPEVKTSMLQDLLAARQTEIESFSGELLRRGARYGLVSPRNRAVYEVCTGVKKGE